MSLLVVDDHAIIRDGLKRLLATAIAEPVLEAADGPQALAILRLQPVSLVILDLNLPGLGGIELVHRIAAKARVLVFSMHAEPLFVARALEAGAAGYVSKNIAPAELLAAVRKVAAGGRYVEQEIAQRVALGEGATGAAMEALSSRELEVMRLLGEGRSLAEIAGALNLSYKTVANGLTAIKAKLGAARTADLVRLAVQMQGGG